MLWFAFATTVADVLGVLFVSCREFGNGEADC